MPAHLLTLMESPLEFEAVAGFPAADGLRAMFMSDDVSPAWLATLRASKDADPWQHGFFLLDRSNSVAIGSAGFRGPVDDAGMVEIAYGVVPAVENRGLATEAAQALVTFAMATNAVHLVRAHTLPTPNASTRVLTKCGFVRVEELVDPDDGLVWRWERGR
ncbi:MAG: GNAT family N-acetyltransferase [bacterium]